MNTFRNTFVTLLLAMSLVVSAPANADEVPPTGPGSGMGTTNCYEQHFENPALATITAERDRLRNENTTLQTRVWVLEDQISDMNLEAGDLKQKVSQQERVIAKLRAKLARR